MIKRVLHYCWFGSERLPDSVQQARATWQQAMPDFEIVEWNESNSDIDRCAYSSWCAERGRWAFVSDYVKADVLRRHGGVFLDSDVVAHKSLAPFLSHRAFSGFERTGFPFTAVWAAEPGHSWPERAAAYLEAITRPELESSAGRLEPNTDWMSRLLTEQYGIVASLDTYQEGIEGVAIYPSETFCLGAHVGWTSHLFSGSWLTPDQRGQWGVTIGDTREASVRMETISPELLVGMARLADFYDGGSAAGALGPEGSQWVSEALPGAGDVPGASRTYLSVLRRATGLYVRGCARRVRSRR